MSLVVDTKDKDKDIPIGRDGKKTIYFSQKKDETKREYHSENDMKIIPCYNIKANQRSSTFISGISGSGKSTVARQVLDEIVKLSKPEMVILFTKTRILDPVFEDLRAKSAKLFRKSGVHNFMHLALSVDEHYLMTQAMAQDIESILSKTVLIFDDFQNMGEKAKDKFMMNFLTDVLERSRKFKTNLIIITHITMGGYQTKSILSECDTYINFPSANRNSVKKFLTNYSDLGKDEITRFIQKADEPFDFLVYHKSYPIYFMTKRSITLV